VILRDPVHGIVAFEAEEEAVLVRLFSAREGSGRKEALHRQNWQ